MKEGARILRCDLHVHSRHSGPATVPVLGLLAQECYSTPQQVYEEARRKGMDLVTLTDHDTIAGALELAGRPDTFVSEEVTCLLPEGRQLHLGVFDISERQHEVISRRRSDAESLFAFLAEERIPVCANHLFSALTGHRSTEDIQLALRHATLVETRNGMMSAACNETAERVALDAGRSGCGGSDAHTLATVARAYTCVRARDKREFLAGLRHGWTLPAGASGTYARFTADLCRILAGALSDHAGHAAASLGHAGRFAAALAVAMGAPLLPLIAAALYAHEQAFTRHHDRLFHAATRWPRPAFPLRPTPATELAG
jgi:predicted metal-dependent phosphoesterase TrpH